MAPNKREAMTDPAYPLPVALRSAPLAHGARITVAVDVEPEVVRRGLIALLEEDEALRVTRWRPDAPPADADVAVVGAAPAGPGLRCPVVVCSDAPAGAHSAQDGGPIAGVLAPRTLTGDQLRATVHAAAAGLAIQAPDGAAAVALPVRERRILELVAEGCSTREIADALSYSERTIKKLIHALEHRLGARNRAHAVASAIRLGLI
jgi:DNA-binding CsgD family transcriptional regulator